MQVFNADAPGALQPQIQVRSSNGSRLVGYDGDGDVVYIPGPGVPVVETIHSQSFGPHANHGGQIGPVGGRTDAAGNIFVWYRDFDVAQPKLVLNQFNPDGGFVSQRWVLSSNGGKPDSVGGFWARNRANPARVDLWLLLAMSNRSTVNDDTWVEAAVFPAIGVYGAGLELDNAGPALLPGGGSSDGALTLDELVSQLSTKGTPLWNAVDKMMRLGSQVGASKAIGEAGVLTTANFGALFKTDDKVASRLGDATWLVMEKIAQGSDEPVGRDAKDLHNDWVVMALMLAAQYAGPDAEALEATVHHATEEAPAEEEDPGRLVDKTEPSDGEEVDK